MDTTLGKVKLNRGHQNKDSAKDLGDSSLLHFLNHSSPTKDASPGKEEATQHKLFHHRKKYLMEELEKANVDIEDGECRVEKSADKFLRSTRPFVPEILLKVLDERPDIIRSVSGIHGGGGYNPASDDTNTAESSTDTTADGDRPVAEASKRNLRDQGELLPFVIPTDSAVVLADLSGFTKESERLCSKGRVGLDELDRVMYDAFSKLVNTFYAQGGDVIKFAGDALIVCWSKNDDESESDNALRAVQCAFELATGPPVSDRMSLHVGIAVGKVEFVAVGHPRRYEFSCFISGRPMVEMGIACDTASGGEVVLHPSCHNVVKDSVSGEVVGAQECFKVLSIDQRIPLVPLQRYKVTVRTIKNLLYFVPYTFQIGRKVEKETRDVIILFIKLEGDVINKILQGEESASGLQDIFYTMMSILERCGGMMRQFLVDDKGVVMIVAFGVPNFVHGDDPFRSVDCALHISTNLEKNHDVQTHIGITSGRAFCGFVGVEIRREYVIVGDTVNLAARLMALSAKHKELPTSPKGNSGVRAQHVAPSRVICDERVRTVIQSSNFDSHFKFTEMDTVKLKGKSKVVQAYIVDHAVTGEFSIQQDLRCYGRDAELDRVAEQINDPEIRVVVFCAEGTAGNGKTTFLQGSLKRAYECGYKPVLASSIFANVGNPYSAFVRIMRFVLPQVKSTKNKKKKTNNNDDDDDIFGELTLPSMNKVGKRNSDAGNESKITDPDAEECESKGVDRGDGEGKSSDAGGDERRDGEDGKRHERKRSILDNEDDDDGFDFNCNTRRGAPLMSGFHAAGGADAAVPQEPTVEDLDEALRAVDSNTWTVDAWDPDTGDMDARNAPSYTEQMYKLLKPLFVNEYVVRRYLSHVFLGLDNVHLVDDCSWTLIEDMFRLASELEGVRFGVMMTCLSHSTDNSHGRTGQIANLVSMVQNQPKCYASTLEIGPLDRENTENMLLSLFPTDSDMIRGDEFMNFIMTTSEGNPFMSKELAQGALKRRGQIELVDGVESETTGKNRVRSNSTLGVSSTIERAVLARVDELSSGAKKVLSVASVIGRDFLYVMLRNLLPPTFRVTKATTDVASVLPEHARLLETIVGTDMLVTELDTALVELLAGEFITRLESRSDEQAKEGQRFMFTHGMIMLISYNLMMESEKQRRHKRAARWIESTYQDDLRPYFVRLMHHYFESRELVKAGDYAVRAIRMTVRAGAMSEAIELYTYALDMVQNDELSQKKMIAGFQLFLNEFDEFGNLAKTEKRLSVNTNEVVTANIASYHAFTKVGGVYAEKVVDEALNDKYNFGQERSSTVQNVLKALESKLNSNDTNDKMVLVTQMTSILQNMGLNDVAEGKEGDETVAEVAAAAAAAPAVPTATTAPTAAAAATDVAAAANTTAASTTTARQQQQPTEQKVAEEKTAGGPSDEDAKQIGKSAMCTVL